MGCRGWCFFPGPNLHDSVPLTALLEAVPRLQGARGRPRHRPSTLHADKAYDYRRCREACTVRGITLYTARRAPRQVQKYEARQAPLGDRTHFCLAQSCDAASHSIQTQTIYLLRLHIAAMCDDLF